MTVTPPPKKMQDYPLSDTFTDGDSPVGHIGGTTKRASGQLLKNFFNSNMHAASMSALIAIDYTKLDDGYVVILDAFYSTAAGVPGIYVWNATGDKATHNGGTIVDPDIGVTPGASGWWTPGNSGPGVWNMVYSGAIDVRVFGAKDDGITDASVAAQMACGLGINVVFDGDEYLLGSQINITNSNITVSGTATLNITGNVGFQVGVPVPSSDASLYENVIFEKMKITCDSASATLGQYIKLFQLKGGGVNSCVFENAGNGGIYVGIGCIGVCLEKNIFYGTRAYTTKRNIWVAGDYATSYTSQLMDISTLERNATPYPTNTTPRDIKIVNCNMRNETGSNYGIYVMNARQTIISGCNIEGDLRCIAVNNYSPQTKISNCVLKDTTDTSGTGILVTQYSTDVKIDNVLFTGSFGGNRAVYCQYGGQAKITNCDFEDIGSNAVEIDMAGYADIVNCSFNRMTSRVGRNISIKAIDSTAGAGNSATNLTLTPVSVRGCYLGENDFQDVLFASMKSADATKVFSAAEVVFRENNVVGSATKAMIKVTEGHDYKVFSGGNRFTGALGFRDVVEVDTISGTLTHHSDLMEALVKVDVVSASCTVTRVQGGGIRVNATVSTDDIVLDPRDITSGVALIAWIIPATANIQYAKIADSSVVSPVATFYNSSDAVVSAATNDFSFFIKIVSQNTSGL